MPHVIVSGSQAYQGATLRAQALLQKALVGEARMEEIHELTLATLDMQRINKDYENADDLILQVEENKSGLEDQIEKWRDSACLEHRLRLEKYRRETAAGHRKKETPGNKRHDEGWDLIRIEKQYACRDVIRLLHGQVTELNDFAARVPKYAQMSHKITNNDCLTLP